VVQISAKADPDADKISIPVSWCLWCLFVAEISAIHAEELNQLQQAES
jgi:hypothetical protein